MRPINQGTALSVSATNNSTTNRATNSHFAWRAKCQKNAMRPAGGSGCFGESVGRNNVSNRANMIRWRPGALLHGLGKFANASRETYDKKPVAATSHGGTMCQMRSRLRSFRVPQINREMNDG
jgi:hypothetical protein